MPRSGKTTILRNVIEAIGPRVGFLTEEVTENGERVGFEVITHKGKRAMLASIHSGSNLRVSRYGVMLEDFEKLIASLNKFSDKDTLYIDEIGQMELFSKALRVLVTTYLDAENLFVGTISKVYSDKFTEDIKSRGDVVVIDVTSENREAKKRILRQLIWKVQKAKIYASKPELFTLVNGTIVMNAKHGEKTLRKKDNTWNCDCDFFKENHLCSHSLAALELHPIK